MVPKWLSALGLLTPLGQPYHGWVLPSCHHPPPAWEGYAYPKSLSDLSLHMVLSHPHPREPEDQPELWAWQCRPTCRSSRPSQNSHSIHGVQLAMGFQAAISGVLKTWLCCLSRIVGVGAPQGFPHSAQSQPESLASAHLLPGVQVPSQHRELQPHFPASLAHVCCGLRDLPCLTPGLRFSSNIVPPPSPRSVPHTLGQSLPAGSPG